MGAPIVGDRIARKGCQAYHRSFVDALAAHPTQVLLSVLHAHSPAGPRTAAGPTGEPTPGAIAGEPVHA